VRILFTFAGGSGHLEPLVPLARAAESVGHTLAFAARPWMVSKVEALGFVAFPTGSDRGLAPVTRPLVELDAERELRDLRDGFGRRIARERAADLLPLCGKWRPDLIVREETDFGAAVIAERLEIPHANVLVCAAGSFVQPSLMASALDEVRADHGLPADPAAEMLNRYLVLTPFPVSFRDPAFPLPPTSYGLRLFDVDDGVGEDSPDPSNDFHARAATPAWATRLPGAPTVYLTLGTVFNHESGDLFSRVIAGLHELPINLLVTVGREIDPADFGPQPSNVRVERYVPQAEVLPHVDLVMSHGGSGSILGALAFGRPMVLIPIGADQPLNSARCEALGVGRILDALRARPSDVADAVTDVLADASYRRAAGRLRDEIAKMPGPGPAVDLLERLAVERRPIIAA
jgi:UDP:flavonoid glycosyltransferase YjiC (YdhE family)